MFSRIHQWSHLVLGFFFIGRFLIANTIHLLEAYSYCPFILSQFWKLVFWTLSIPSVFQFIDLQLLIVSCHNTFYFYKIGSNVSSSVPDFSHLYFFLVFVKGFSILLIFSNNKLLFCWFLYCFLVSISFLCGLIFVFPSFCLCCG